MDTPLYKSEQAIHVGFAAGLVLMLTIMFFDWLDTRGSLPDWLRLGFLFFATVVSIQTLPGLKRARSGMVFYKEEIEAWDYWAIILAALAVGFLVGLLLVPTLLASIVVTSPWIYIFSLLIVIGVTVFAYIEAEIGALREWGELLARSPKEAKAKLKEVRLSKIVKQVRVRANHEKQVSEQVLEIRNLKEEILEARARVNVKAVEETPSETKLSHAEQIVSAIAEEATGLEQGLAILQELDSLSIGDKEHIAEQLKDRFADKFTDIIEKS